MLDDLARFLARPLLVETAAAVIVAFAALDAVRALVQGLVTTPVETPATTPFERRTGVVAIAGRTFDWIDPATALLVLAVVMLGVAFVVHRTAAQRGTV